MFTQRESLTAMEKKSYHSQLEELIDEQVSQIPPHFGLLLMDVDAVEYSNSYTDECVLFKMRIPERTYGRISGLDWDVISLSKEPQTSREII